MFKIKVIHGGREIEIEVPLNSSTGALDYNEKAIINILKATVEEVIKLNQ